MANKRLTKHGIEVRNRMKQMIIEYICEHGYSPTVREIAEMVGLKSTSSVHSHLNIMLENGMLDTDHGFGTPRAIRVPGYKFMKTDGDKIENLY